MKEKILQNASELFLNYGFKSITMDDIANAIGISKKTIYLHFSNKTKLVEASTLYMFELISHGIDGICALNKNPIEEVYEIKKFVMDHLKDEKSSPQYQLQKYYPKIFDSLKSKQFLVMKTCVTENLKKGLELGLYRATIDVDFISTLYINSMIALKDKQLFPLKNHSMKVLMDYYLEYHLRGICTPKGLDTLSKLITNNKISK